MKDHFEAPGKLIPPKSLASLSTVGVCKSAIYVQTFFSEGSGHGSCNEGGPASC